MHFLHYNGLGPLGRNINPTFRLLLHLLLLAEYIPFTVILSDSKKKAQWLLIKCTELFSRSLSTYEAGTISLLLLLSHMVMLWKQICLLQF
ncbi:hypothetical protein GDO86_000148 [Hymenochirus boettgeri]|uniref:Uncharacterized protein n=1 Tax=Hymenochirus boettgeri TaxID=247094 RepID=A0A8T2KDC4_9PIPI|nr:hypothetical protein GDO86_000148 [Hymenochirus boettgeri]